MYKLFILTTVSLCGDGAKSAFLHRAVRVTWTSLASTGEDETTDFRTEYGISLKRLASWTAFWAAYQVTLI